MTKQEKNWQKEQEFVTWANSKLQEHGLTDWHLMVMMPFQIDMLTHTKCGRAVGTCFRTKRWIWVSQQFVYDYKLHTSQDVFLHEVAHALTKKGGHTPEFRRVAKEIGCQGVLARNNLIIFDKYKKFDVTPKQYQNCFNTWYKKNRRG